MTFCSFPPLRVLRLSRPAWLLLAALAAPAASAQMLPSGAWTGTLAGPDGSRQPVEAEIARCATGFTLAMTVGERTAHVPESKPAVWQGGRLRFTTTRLRLPGTLLARPLVCDLAADAEGRLGGLCTSGSRRHRLELAPPEDAAVGCD